MIPPPPHFLSGYPVHKAGKSLYPQIALVLPSRSDRNGVLRNIFQQLVAVRCRRSDKLLMVKPILQSNSHMGSFATSRIHLAFSNSACEHRSSRRLVYYMQKNRIVKRIAAKSGFIYRLFILSALSKWTAQKQYSR